jgi:hypothetical protein
MLVSELEIVCKSRLYPEEFVPSTSLPSLPMLIREVETRRFFFDVASFSEETTLKK